MTNTPNLPTSSSMRRLQGSEAHDILAVILAYNDLATALPTLERRFRSIPNGWRDAKLLLAVSKRLFENVIDTVPLEQHATLMHNLHNATVRICVKDAGRMRGCEYVSTDALDKLFDMTVKHICPLCDKSEADMRKCELRQAFRELPYHTDELLENCNFRWGVI